MIWVDNAFAGLLTLYSLGGLMRGYSQVLFSIMAWTVGIAVSWFFSNDFAIFLVKYVTTIATRLALSFIALILITITLAWLINLLRDDGARPARLTLLERLGGILLGAMQGVVVAFALVLIAGLTPLPEENWWHKSQFVPPFQAAATLLRDNLPSKLAVFINYH